MTSAACVTTSCVVAVRGLLCNSSTDRDSSIGAIECDDDQPVSYPNRQKFSSTHNPSASLSSPTETHAAAAGIFRSTGSPPWFLEGCDTDDLISELSIDDSEDPIDVDKTFTKRHEFPGTVKIVVESTTFWAHKEVLYFASPFFQAALSGDWAETGRPASMSSVITISQPPVVLGNKRRSDAPTEMTFAPMDPDIDPEELDIDLGESSDAEASDSSQAMLLTQDDEHSNVEMSAEPKKKPGTMKARGNRASATKVVVEVQPEEKETARKESLDKLQGGSPRPTEFVPPEPPKANEKGKARAKNGQTVRLSWKKGATEAAVRRRQKVNGPDAVIVLKEEKASTFHDFLHFVYPGMECTITWNNVEGLMNIAHKLCVPSLQRKCLNFLLTHAAGRPIKAMRIAELFEEEELYRESSRFVLDNPGGWSEHELSTLSSETLLRLERRRTWFLERVLKLGLIQIAKEYECCSSCSDPSSCARLLEEKWRQAYQAVFRFGPCQPSMVFRYLRTLEGISPPLALSHLACQSTAKAFIATLFDRMFTLGVRGSGTDTAPLGARVAAVAGVAGPRRHFLYCSLRPENPAPRPPRNRDATNWEVWNLDKHQAISIYKLGEGFLEGISSRLERRYLDRDALWLADLEDLEKVKPDIKKRQSTHDDDYDAALLRAFESARPSKRSKQLENVAGIAGHELACPNAELIKPVPVVPPTAYFSLLSAELIHCINDHIHDYLDVILFALTCRRHWQIGRKHIASRFLSMAYWGGDRIICLGDNCDPFDIPDTLELTDAEKAKLDRWKARRLESDDNADDDPHDNEDDNENDKEEDKEKDNEEETEEDNEGDNEDEDNDEDNEGEDNDEDEDWDDDPESPGSVLYRLLGETVDPLTTSIIEERLSNLQPDWRKPKEFYWLFRTLTTPDFAQKKYGVRIPPARGEECKILRNLSRREYVHSKTLQEFKARYSEEHPGTEVTSELQRVGLSEAVVLRTTWSSDGSCSMSYEEKKDDLHRGVWAGNRFDIVSESTFEKEKEEGWKDVSEEVVSELIAVWECEYA